MKINTQNRKKSLFLSFIISVVLLFTNTVPVSARTVSWMDQASEIKFGQTRSGSYLRPGIMSELHLNFETFYFYVPIATKITINANGTGTDPYNVELRDSSGKYMTAWGKSILFSDNDWKYNPSSKKASMNVKKTLSPGYYYIQLIDYDERENVKWSIRIDGTVAAKPTIKSIKKTGSKSVCIRWKKVPGATGYQVYMKKGSGSYKLIKALSGTKLNKKGLKKGKKYTFMVRAFKNTNGKVLYSEFAKKSKKI